MVGSADRLVEWAVIFRAALLTSHGDAHGLARVSRALIVHRAFHTMTSSHIARRQLRIVALIVGITAKHTLEIRVAYFSGATVRVLDAFLAVPIHAKRFGHATVG